MAFGFAPPLMSHLNSGPQILQTLQHLGAPPAQFGPPQAPGQAGAGGYPSLSDAFKDIRGLMSQFKSAPQPPPPTATPAPAGPGASPDTGAGAGAAGAGAGAGTGGAPAAAEAAGAGAAGAAGAGAGAGADAAGVGAGAGGGSFLSSIAALFGF